MSQELFIHYTQHGSVTIALLRDRKLTELHQEKGNNSFNVGDIYLGSVNRLMPGLNAAFIDVGYEKDAFLHYLDLGKQVNSLAKYTRMVQNGRPSWQINSEVLEEDIVKTGKINQILKRSEQVVVQISKEPIANKGPRLTSELSLAGRFLVLIPFETDINVSKKISAAEERARLKTIIRGLRPANFGVIIRTNASGVGEDELRSDMEELIGKWEHIFNQLKVAKPKQKLLGENDRTLTLIRDLVNADFTAIHVDDAAAANEIKSYLKKKAPGLEKIVRHYSGKESIFEHFEIEKKIKTSFGKEINFYGGCYLIIEHTEALHVIDVNSGNSGNKVNQEENALQVNLEAASEVARQLRLRDMGGIIVVDFIDMKSPQNRKQLYEKLKAEMASDRAKHKILPMSPFGLIQITRQRVRPEMAVPTSEVCPACKGTGEVQNSVALLDEIENNVDYLIQNLHVPNFTLELHPYLAAYFTRGFIRSVRMKWFFKYKRWIPVFANNNLHLGDYRFTSKDGEAIHI